MPTTVLPSVTRCHYLDNLKVLLTVLVVFHHAGQAYGDGGAWPYSPSLSHEYVGWLGNFFPVNAAFFMGLFFLISAYFIPGSLDRSGTKQFVRKRAIRLGVPMLVVLILSLSVTGKAEFAHTWFLEHLLFYSLAYVCTETGQAVEFTACFAFGSRVIRRYLLCPVGKSDRPLENAGRFFE